MQTELEQLIKNAFDSAKKGLIRALDSGPICASQRRLSNMVFEAYTHLYGDPGIEHRIRSGIESRDQTYTVCVRRAIWCMEQAAEVCEHDIRKHFDYSIDNLRKVCYLMNREI